MKLFFSTMALTAALAALPAAAQETPKPVAPPPAPAPGTTPPPAQAPGTTPPKAPGTPASGAAGQPAAQPGLLPAPATAPAIPDGFKSDKEAQSYALGLFFANNLKQEETNRGTPLPKPDELLKGMKDVLSGAKSLDYVIGAHLASQIQRSGVELDSEVLADAVRSSLTSATLKLNPQQSQEAMNRLNQALAKKKEEKRQADNAAALAAAAKFLESNSKGEGVKQTPSGLQYKVEKAGDGKSPAETDLVTMNFTCTMLDATIVEKSPETGPARKVMKSLPQGLKEGLQLLKTGSKAKFWLPPALGYGEAGRLGLVKANAVIVYDVELLGVEPAPKPATLANPGVTPGSGTQPPRPPVTAVTPPITVEIPPRPGDKPAAPAPPTPGVKPPKRVDPIPPVRPAPPSSTPPVPVPPPPAPPPAPPPNK
jgi:FKBP-type peptidyl-prolyl cis-trans isomerase